MQLSSSIFNNSDVQTDSIVLLHQHLLKAGLEISTFLKFPMRIQSATKTQQMIKKNVSQTIMFECKKRLSFSFAKTL